MLEFKLICHFVGNLIMWILNFGTKSIDDISKKDNSRAGLIFLVIICFAVYSKT
jgi:hypothetical protein